MINALSTFEKAVYAFVKKIPKGKVSTYGVIARKIGRPRAARAVGNALNKNPFACLAEVQGRPERRRAPKVPCHRVVRSDGNLGGFARGAREKARMLKEEGVNIKDGKIKDFIKEKFGIIDKILTT